MQLDADKETWHVSRVEVLQREKHLLSAQVAALSTAREAQDAHIVSLSKDAEAAMVQCKALAAAIADLSAKADRVSLLESRNAQLEKLVLEATAAREALGKEVGARDSEIHACQQRIHMLQEEALSHRGQVHTANAATSALQMKLQDANARLSALQSSELRLTERVEQLQEQAAKAAGQLAAAERARVQATEALEEAQRSGDKHAARAADALNAARKATEALMRGTRDKAAAARLCNDHDVSMMEEMLSMRMQLQLQQDAAKARQVQLDALSSRCATAEQERDRARVATSVLEEQNLSQAKSLAHLSQRLQQVSIGAASSEQGSAVAGANAFHAVQRAQRAEDAERVLSERVDKLTAALRDSEGKCHVLLQELARTEKVRVAAENEGRARMAAEEQAGEMLKELTRTRSQLQVAHAHVWELQGCAKALEGAGEDAALARQLVVDKEAECEELRRKLEASHQKLVASRKKADAVRSKEEPLLQRVQQAEAAAQEAKARSRELETLLASAKREAAYARGEQRECERETAEMRRQVVKLERAALAARDRFRPALRPESATEPLH